MKKNFFYVSNYNLKYYKKSNNILLDNLMFDHNIKINLFNGFKKYRLDHCITAIFQNIFEEKLSREEFHYLMFFSVKYLDSFKLADDLFYDKYLSTLCCKLRCSNRFCDRFDFFVKDYFISLSDLKSKDLILLIVDFYLILNQK